MKFTVVIPTFNRADLVEQALQSVLAQTCEDFEIIIVDDGSEEPIHPSIGDSRIRIIRHEKNRGAAAARNTGINNAQGELIAFLDSDDLWFPQKLEKQANFMNDLSYGACVTSYEYDTDEGNKIVILHKPKSWLRQLSLTCNQAPGTTLAVRRECYLSVGLYDETMLRHEDYDWLLRFTQKFDLGVLEIPLAKVNLGGNPSAASIQVANQIILDRYGKLFFSLGRFNGTRAYGRRYLETAVFYSWEGNKSLSLKYLWYTISTNPFQHPGMLFRVLENTVGFSLYPKAKIFWRSFVKGRFVKKMFR